jgi:hypothetical protein
MKEGNQIAKKYILVRYLNEKQTTRGIYKGIAKRQNLR